MNRTFRALDFVFAVDTGDPDLLEHLTDIFGSLRETDEAGPPRRYAVTELDGAEADRHCLWFEGSPVVRSAVPGELLSHLLWHVNGQAVAASQRYLLLHAAVAAAGERAVLVAGGSGAGKSTLVAALVDAGLAYLSDEIAAVDVDDLVVVAYPKPIVLGPGSWEAVPAATPPSSAGAIRYDFGERVVDARHIGPGAVGRIARPAAVVFPGYEAGASTSLRPMSRAEAVVGLLEHSFNGAAHGRRGVEALAEVVRGCVCRRLDVGDAAEAAALVAGLL